MLDIQVRINEPAKTKKINENTVRLNGSNNIISI